MRTSQTILGAFVSASLLSDVSCFSAGSALISRVGSKSTGTTLFLTPEEERAELLSSYLAKSHEEKLKAVRAVEEKKDAEINSLREELKQVRASAPPAAAAVPAAPAIADGPPSVGADVEALSKDELVNAVKSYQQFMAKYIVEAQEQKTNAVKAAESAVAQKYEAKPQQLTGESAAPEPAPAPEPVASEPTPVAKTESPAPAPAQKDGDLYAQRNARVVAAAAAGKSRWGDAEVERAESPDTSAAPKDRNLYAQRNARLVAAATAGKSRWGNLEVDRAVFLTDRAKAANVLEQANGASEAAGVPPEIEAADHGLRNDGGVGGMTLAERVSIGAGAASQTVNGAVAATNEEPADLSSKEKLYTKRNERIAAAARAGKSRWGDLEVVRINQSVSSVLESKEADIAAADHGLQPDQGVSLADRVNLGARLLGE